MGNQLEREHDVGPVVATGGPDGIWKIYTAKKKDTGEPVSIWVFEKKQLEKHSRDVQEAVLAMLRADVTNLSRLVHPNVLRDFSGLPKVPSALENFELDPLEAKLGLLELAEGLAFLHGHARIVHRNVCPESIFLTQKGMWKLGGFHFGLFLSSRQARETMRLDYREFDYKPPFRVSPNLDYMAPEAADGQWEPSSDMWSLGMVAWQLHTRKPPPSTRNNLLTHRAVVERIRSMDWTQFPDALQDVRTFLESPYFKDTLLLALVFLNDLITKDNPSKLKFFKGLASVLPRFPPRLIKEKVVAALLAELGRSEGELQALVLQSVLASSRGTLTASEFSRLVLPSLLPLITPEAPMPCLLLLLGELETLAKLAPPDDVSQYLVPLVVRALESPNPKLNEEALKQLPKVAAVRDVVVPRLELLMANTRLEPIRARILITLKDVVEIVDKSTVSDRVLAIVDTCLAIDRSAPTLMRCIVVYDLISDKVGMEITAARILPFVVPLLLEPQLGAQQVIPLFPRRRAG
ncbi:protein kinase domain containing protein [Acanthamoeba castellanii str. Neff]|uniref:Protein kinase domain containing protein n=1 Tax=Acanthamoeba castellanii (strain ATCC 30010 / Neff) TaxID=1257118 RepID=L8H5A4_ACACF|nr:protein kinase domain containing protein [Acanthamoeba castellanii str. Neff]ELR20417.1 protein kinase domain containing protein [Acanthamoeba castellanii str. Neff]